MTATLPMFGQIKVSKKLCLEKSKHTSNLCVPQSLPHGPNFQAFN